MQNSCFSCPVCKKPLAPDGRRLLCENRHSFDMAKEGYVNLLLKNTQGGHGDNAEMLTSRRAFLSVGHYGFLRDAVALAVASRMTADTKGFVFFDAGCGEGYYTEAILDACTQKAREFPSLSGENALSFFGIDISRDAVRMASRRLPALKTAAASLYDIPLPDASVDAMTLLFSPFCREEFCRILKKGGTLVMAIPGRRHLYGLKEALYKMPYENEVADFFIEGFRLLSHTHLEKTVTLKDRDVLSALFKMTPYYYRTPPAAKERLAALSALTTPFAFELLVYEKE